MIKAKLGEHLLVDTIPLHFTDNGIIKSCAFVHLVYSSKNKESRIEHMKITIPIHTQNILPNDKITRNVDLGWCSMFVYIVDMVIL